MAQETDIFVTFASIFGLTDGESVTHQLKAKSLNVCANMAIASSESIQEMLEPKYGVFAQVNRVLTQQHTYELLENNLWLLANITGDCDELCNLVL